MFARLRVGLGQPGACTSRTFMTSATVRTRIGSKAIKVPRTVEFRHDPTLIENLKHPKEMGATKLYITGPKGTNTVKLMPFINLNITGMENFFTETGPKPFEEKARTSTDEEGEEDEEANFYSCQVGITNPNDDHQRAMWSTTRTLINNAVNGVTNGYFVPLRLVGVGYRAVLVEPTKLVLYLGFSHAVECNIPDESRRPCLRRRPSSSRATICTT